MTKLSNIRIGSNGIERKQTLIGWVLCKMGRHDMVIVKQLTWQSQKLSCSRCKECFLHNTSIKATSKWNKVTEDFFDMIRKGE
jgi:hypothetical protein